MLYIILYIIFTSHRRTCSHLLCASSFKPHGRPTSLAFYYIELYVHIDRYPDGAKDVVYMNFVYTVPDLSMCVRCL